MNQYIEIAKLVLTVITFVITAIKDKKASEQEGGTPDVSGQVDKGVSLLQNIGKIAKVKELQGLDITELKPVIGDLITKLHELKALNKE